MAADSCTLFGLFGWMVQLLLAVLCFLSLICTLYLDKRYREAAPRPWLIFFLVRVTQDISKQGFSATLAHTMNVMIAVLFSKWQEANPCEWYFINMMLDTTLGVFMSFTLLSLLENLAFRMNWTSLHSGHYRDKDSEEVNLEAWATQLVTWGLIVMTVRLTQGKCIIVSLMWLTANQLNSGGHFLLRKLEDSPRLELIVVMVFCPLVMNLLQFWIQDTFLKESKKVFPPMASGATE